ncbi:MAG: alginate lyase family protein, partial [Candidatus Ornithospirochaeta sp.]|nr:alginate lyase family protein [Candidatus Ornithospirochaeta sp.]
HEVAYCFDEDGIHMERTPIYHMVASIAFLQSVLLCRKNGIYVPDYAMAKIEKSAEFLMDITKPDFSTPMLGDADRNDFLSWKADTSVYEGMNLSFFPDDMNEIRAYFALMAKLTGREDFLYVSTGGKEGKAPEKNESKFSDGGIYVFRTGFGKEDYLMTQMVRLESGEVSSHSHNDTGHVELMLGGEDILIDCGRYIYNSSIWKDWRHYFLSAKAHNTFYCDDHYNGEIEEFPKRRGVRGTCHKFESTDRYKIVDISHNGFAYLDDPVFHRRACILLPGKDCLVVIDKVTGLSGADHDMRFYWNFATDNGEADEAKAVYTAPSGKRYELEYFSSVDGWKGSMLIGSEDPKGGWVSYGYPVRKPIAQYCVSRMGKAPFVMATVIKKEGTECSVSFDEGRIRIDGIQIAFDDKGVEVL